MMLSANKMRSYTPAQNLAKLSQENNYFTKSVSFGLNAQVQDVFQKTNLNIYNETNSLIKSLFVDSIDFKAFSDYLKERRIPQKDINTLQEQYKQDIGKIYSNVIKENQGLSTKEVEDIHKYLNKIGNTLKEVELFIYKSILPFAITPELYDQMRLGINKVLEANNKEEFNIGLNELQTKGISFSEEEQNILWKYPVAMAEVLKQPNMNNAKNKLKQLINDSLKEFIISEGISDTYASESKLMPNLISKYFKLATQKQPNAWHAFQN